MHYTQNDKIAQVGHDSLVIGVDVGSEKQHARAFGPMQIEYTRKAFSFNNSAEGFDQFLKWAQDMQFKKGLKKIMVGFEPTGHYWFNLADCLEEQGIEYVLVAPQHVKHTKELDDNIQQKDDNKDPRVIAKLVFGGRYLYAYRPKGIYAELRVGFIRRCEIMEHLVETKNRITRWFNIYFPEYLKVYRKVDASTGMKILRQAPLPKDIIALGVDGVNKIWRDAKQRGAGKKRATTLVTAAQSSIGSKQADQAARMDLWQLLDEYDLIEKQLREINDLLLNLLTGIPDAQRMLAIQGVGMVTVAGFLAEAGDIRRFTDPKQIVKYAGMAVIKPNDSGKHNGKGKLSRRGRKRLRTILVQAARSLVKSNPDFQQIHKYFTTRECNPLKKIQSICAIANKLIHVFYGMIINDQPYDGEKMLRDIHRPIKAAAKAA